MAEHDAPATRAEDDEVELVIVKNPSANRYEARVDDELIGLAAYVTHGNSRVFVHTEVAPAFQSFGVGGALARAAMDDVRAEGGLKVIPRCPFIKSWLDRHPEYSDLRHGSTAKAEAASAAAVPPAEGEKEATP